MTLRGIDISKHQNVVDFDAAKASGLAEFVIAKSSEGVGYADPRFKRNWAEAKRVGAVRGAYHFARPDLGNVAASEADWFLSVVGDPEAGDFLVLDYEPKTVAPRYNDSETAVAWCRTFLRRVYVETGLRVFIYLNLSQAKGYDWRPVIAEGHALWLAYYGQVNGAPENEDASPPATRWPAVAMKQWTSRGAVPGVGTRCDRNVFYGSREQLLRYGKQATEADMDEATVRRIVREEIDKDNARDAAASDVLATDDAIKDFIHRHEHDLVGNAIGRTSAAAPAWPPKGEGQ